MDTSHLISWPNEDQCSLPPPIFSKQSYVEVAPDTRNHMGFFVSEETYTLIEETEAGWVYICVDDSDDGFPGRCHYVNPADIRFIKRQY